MAFDCFLKIAEVPGESTDEAHKEWIEVLSYSWGISQSGATSVSSHGSLTAARADFADFSIMKALDKASPKIAQACADGTHFTTVEVKLHRAGGTKELFMEYKLTDVIVSSYQPSGSGGGEVPMESISFSYGKAQWNYIPTKVAGGKGSGNVPGGWDLKTNTAAIS